MSLNKIAQTGKALGESKQCYTMNIKNLVYAELIKDTQEEVTYGKVYKIQGLMKIQITPTIATGELYGDGAKRSVANKTTGYDVQLQVNKIPIETRVHWMGHKMVNGVLVSSAKDQPIYIALGYEAEETENHRELTWLLKGNCQPPSRDQEQSEGNIKFSTDSIKLSFIAREYDSNFYYTGDTAFSDFTEEMADKFLKEAPTYIPDMSPVAAEEIV